MEDLATNSDTGLTRLNESRKWLAIVFAAGVIATLAVWIVAMSFPYAIADVYANGFNSNLPNRFSTLLTVLLFLVPFTPPFLSSYTLANLVFGPSIEPPMASELMSSYQYRQGSNKRRLIFVIAGMIGGLNCLLMLIAVTSATGN